MRHLRSFLLSAFLTFPALAWAETPATVQLRVEATPKTITIGDPVKIEITVIVSSSVTPALFKPPTPLGEFEIKDFTSSEPKTLETGKISITHSFTVTTFSTGTQVIPALSLPFQGSDGSLAETKTEEIKIEVKSVLDEKGDEGNLRPLKGLYNFKSYLWIWILLGVAALTGLLIWGWSLYKKNRRLSGEPEGPPQPPEEWAWEKLQKLEDSDFIEKGQVKEFYSQLSYILREYLERRYKISTLDKTSSELMSDIRKMNLTSYLNNLIRDFLETGDLVKFAKYTMNAEESEKDLLKIKEAITLTTPVPATESKEAKESEENIPV